MNVEYNTETQEITVELNAPKIEMNTPTGGRGLKGDKGDKGDTGPAGPSQWGVITGSLSNQTDLKNALDNKVDASSLSTVATSGDYTDLSNKPTIPDELADLTDDSTHRVVTDTEKSTWSGKQDALVSGTNIKTINSQSLLGSGDITVAGASDWGDIGGTLSDQTDLQNALNDKVDNSSLATVATSGDYDDLDNKPTIPTNVSDLNNDSGFISSETDPIYSASAASGITSTDITNWNGKSNFSGSYNDLTDKPTIPTVNNATLTIQKNGTNVNTFTANASSNVTANITVPTNVSDLNNDSGFITSYTETDPVFSASAAAGISSSDITNWNGKSTFSGSYNDLTDKPTIPDELSDLSDDSTHRLVTDTEKSTWSGKQDLLVSGTNIKTINNASLLGSGNISIGGGGTATDVKINGTSITTGGEADILTETAYDSSTNKIATMSDVPDTSSFIDKDVNNLTNYSLTTTIQTNKNLTKGVEYIVGTQGSDTNAWKGTSTDTGCSSGAIYTGKMIMYHLPKAGTSSAATLNLTLPDGSTTGAKNIYRQASTTVTTTFAAGCDIFMVYDGTQWKINAYVDTTNSNTIGYQLRTNSAIWTNKTGYTIKRYVLLFEVDGGLSGAATTIGTGTSKTTVAFKYIPGGVIKYYSTNESVTNNSNFATTTGLWDQYAVNLGYTFNTGSTLESGKPVYMRCTVNSDGTLSPNYAGTPSHPIVQALPSTADGKVYVYLGQAYSTTNIELLMTHPIYEYKNGKIREYVPAIAYSEISGTPSLATVASSGDYDDLLNKPTIPTVPVTDVQANGTSILSSGVANLVTNTAYDSSSNKIATMSDIPTVKPTVDTNSTKTVGYLESTSETAADIDSYTKTGEYVLSVNSNTSNLPFSYTGTAVLKVSGNATRFYQTIEIPRFTDTYKRGYTAGAGFDSWEKIAYSKEIYNIAGNGSDTWSSSGTYNKNETVIYNKKLYRNITGTNTATNPSSDTTNWTPSTIYNEIYDTGWITITPTNGTAGTGNYVPKYRKVGNLVKMTGYITVKNNNAMFTLPEGFRPDSRWTVCGTNDAKNVNEIRITETGNVQLQNTSGSLSSGVPVFLDNVSFFVD